MFQKTGYILFFSLVIVLSSCTSKFQKLLKSADNDLKYEKAIELFEQEDYYRAEQLISQLMAVYRGTDKAEKLFYYYAYCYYNQKDYLMASYYFKKYANTFPNSEEAEESLFKCAYCYFLDSPKYNLDQSNTYEAINEFQLFVNKYPKSERVKECNNLIDDLRSKLEMKAFNIAKLYYKMNDYQAAVVSFNNILVDFPDTEHKEEILFYILKSNYFYAIHSILEKQKDRHREVIESYKDLVVLYPESKHFDDASKMHKTSLKEIIKFK